MSNAHTDRPRASNTGGGSKLGARLADQLSQLNQGLSRFFEPHADGGQVDWLCYAAGFHRIASFLRLAAHSRKYNLMSVREGIPVSAESASK